MSNILKNLVVPNGHKTLAVSDSELNVTDPDGQGSAHSLTRGSDLSGASGACSNLGSAASWAVSFERLLEDPSGVLYFTDFLKSEVSAENILFWQACEKFRKIPANQKDKLTQEARSIYETYLSNSATYAINIDDKARVQERDLECPEPNMFDRAQQQIFKLMKFDSYTRFVRSPLYRGCMLADVERGPLPELGHVVRSPDARRGQATDSFSPSDKRKKKDVAEKRKEKPPEKKVWEKRWEKRELWGAAELSSEPRCPGRSAGRAEWSSPHSKLDVSTRTLAGHSQTRPASFHSHEPAASGQAEKYCCVFFPDGTASLVATRPGLSIRDIIQGLCKKRAIPVSDVSIHLQGEGKQRISLDQDSSLLKEQQVTLEVQVTFMVEVLFTGKTSNILANGSKTLQEALSTTLEQHGLSPQDAVVTMSGSRDVLDITMPVFSIANKQLRLDRAKGKNQNSRSEIIAQPSPPQMAGASEAAVGCPLPADRLRPKRRNPAVRRAYDMDVLMDLLTRVQLCNVDDQRGLLCREHLELPSFLQIPLVECEEKEGQKEGDTCQPAVQPNLALQSLSSSEPDNHETQTAYTLSDLDSSFIGTDTARETIV